MHTAQHNYVISLSTKQDRRNHIIQEFGKQDIPFEFFDAITPDLIEAKAKEFEIDLTNTPLTKGEIACALSHVALWHLAKKQALDYICIFEDDIYLGKNVKVFLTNQYLTNDVDIVKFEKHFSVVKHPFKAEIVLDGRKLYRLQSRHMGAAGYLITRKGIDYILEQLKEYHFTLPIDELVFSKLLENTRYKVLQILPAICIQDFILNKETKFESSLKEERDELSKREKPKKKNIFIRVYKEVSRALLRMRKIILNEYIRFK